MQTRRAEGRGPARLVVGMTGASGAVYGVRLLQALQGEAVETHLVITPPAELTLRLEMGLEAGDVRALADRCYAADDFTAAIASGSFTTVGMMVVPCSIRSLSAIAQSHCDDLLSRAADVTLKEGRPLLLMVRETPLHLGHLRLMTQAAELGAVIFPPVPAFYKRPATVEALVDQTVGRMLARLGIENELYEPWEGVE